MKTITFTEKLISLVQSGQKTQTRRKVFYNSVKAMNDLKPVKAWKVGDICRILNSRFRPKEQFGFIEILDVELTRIMLTSHEDAIAEGFVSQADFLSGWKKIHGKHADIEQLVWKITFEYHKELSHERLS